MTDRTCAELFDHTHATIIGDADRPILGVAYRSDQVSPGDAFCCIVGLKAVRACLRAGRRRSWCNGISGRAHARSEGG